MKFCKRNPGFMDSVRLGAVRAIDECQYQFRARRWNCSTLQESYSKQVNFIKAQLGSKMAADNNNNNNQVGGDVMGYPGLSTSSVYSRAALAAAPPSYPRQFISHAPEPTMNAMLNSYSALREKNNNKGSGGAGGGERKRNSRNIRNERRRGRSSKCKYNYIRISFTRNKCILYNDE